MTLDKLFLKYEGKGVRLTFPLPEKTTLKKPSIIRVKVLINLSAATDFPLLCIEYISLSLSFNYFFKKLFAKFASLV